MQLPDNLTRFQGFTFFGHKCERSRGVGTNANLTDTKRYHAKPFSQLKFQACLSIPAVRPLWLAEIR